MEGVITKEMGSLFQYFTTRRRMSIYERGGWDLKERCKGGPFNRIAQAKQRRYCSQGPSPGVDDVGNADPAAVVFHCKGDSGNPLWAASSTASFAPNELRV